MPVKIKLIIIISFIFFMSGCRLIYIGFENLDNTVFSSPAEKKSKVKEPVKPDVKLSALWIGHSSVLLQIYDKVILIDPVFNNVISGVMQRKQTAAFDITGSSPAGYDTYLPCSYGSPEHFNTV